MNEYMRIKYKWIRKKEKDSPRSRRSNCQHQKSFLNINKKFLSGFQQALKDPNG